jgi:predicted patatin/cPLA2 family phospholipase
MQSREGAPSLEQKIHVDGNLAEVFNDMRQYAEAIKRGETPEFGPLIIFGGGAVGAFASTMGAQFALEHMGYKNGMGAANVVGNSVGAITATMWMNGTLSKFLRDCFNKWMQGLLITGNFNTEGNILHLDTMLDAMLNNPGLVINNKKLRGNPTGLYCFLTKKENGGQEMVNLKKEKSPAMTVILGSALPGLYQPKNATKYTDGTLSGALPISELIAKFKPTSVLVISGAAKVPAKLDGVLARRLVAALGTDDMKVVRRRAKEMAKKTNEELGILPEFERGGGKYAVVWPSDKVGLAEKDPVKIITEIAEVFNFILEKMGLPPAIIPMD